MPFIHGKFTNVYYDDKNLSAYFNTASRNSSVETAETTVFGKSHKTYISGLRDGTASLSGLFDGAAGAVDEELAASLGSSSYYPLTILPSSTPAKGDTLFLGRAITTSYEVSAPVGDVVSTSAEFQSDLGMHTGVLLLASSTSITATASTTSHDFGTSPTPPTAGGWVACLHVLTNTRSANVAFALEDSSDNSTWANLGTFTTVSATSTVGQTLTIVPDSVARYVRVTYTVSAGTGAMTAVVSFARIL
jgi:hypothetical protein